MQTNIHVQHGLSESLQSIECGATAFRREQDDSSAHHRLGERTLAELGRVGEPLALPRSRGGEADENGFLCSPYLPYPLASMRRGNSLA